MIREGLVQVDTISRLMYASNWDGLSYLVALVCRLSSWMAKRVVGTASLRLRKGNVSRWDCADLVPFSSVPVEKHLGQPFVVLSLTLS